MGWKSLWLHRLRSLLTALGIVFGVASVIAMLAIGEGASFEAQQQIRLLGSQNIIVKSVKPEESSNDSGAERSYILHYGITHLDIRQIEQTVPGVDLTVPTRSIKELVRHQSASLNSEIHGTIPSYLSMRGLELLRGRFFTDLEIDHSSNVCVLEEHTARALFPLEDPLGKAIRIKGTYFRVIGISEGEAPPAPTKTEDPPTQITHRIYTPISSLLERFGEVSLKIRSGSFEAERVEFSEITAYVSDSNQVIPSANAIRRILARNHPDGDYEVVVPIELLRQAERTRQIFNIVLGSIAAISLLVGGIGIMNIMLATVTERTREIGVRRALGAKRADIVTQFLIETVILSGTGGLIGVALGLLIPALVSHFAEMPTVVTLWAPLLAFTISLAIGIGFGIYPAKRAASMSPVEALRHE